MLLDDPDFPPLITGRPVPEGKCPSDKAFSMASSGEAGAGDLFWSRETGSAKLAIVLEPETSAEDALCMIPLAMVVVADSIGAIGPPNLPITFDWPKTILANGAIVGGVDARFPPNTRPSDQPDFMILSLHLNIVWDSATEKRAFAGKMEPGENLVRTVLHEEGAGDLTRTHIIESWARHFTAWIDTWEQDGFKSVHENWLFRAHHRNEVTGIDTSAGRQTGVLIGMDEKGGLLLKRDTVTQLVSLKDIWFEYEKKRVLQ